MSSIFSIVSVPLGALMRYIYLAVNNYGLTLLLFTLLTKILLFPLSINQQKSMAKTSAYQPMIEEIRKKWANDKNRQNEELVKMQQEYGFSPTAGCWPLLAQLPIMFGLIDVIYKPMRYILNIPVTLIPTLQEKCVEMGAVLSSYSPQSSMIQFIKDNATAFSGMLSGDQLASIQGFDMVFMGIDLAALPTLALNVLLLVPILSVVTMVAQQLLSMKFSGNTQNKGQMIYTLAMTSLMFGYISFKLPAGVSMYWIFGNIFGIVQAFILKKMYDPEDYKAKLAAEIEAKRQEKRTKKKVTVTDVEGEVVEKEVSQSELESLRLQRARELERQKYGE